MKKKFTLLMASMMLLGASFAQAAWMDGCCYQDPCCEDQTGFYIGAFGGANWLNYARHHHNHRQNYTTGYVVAGSLGYRWCHDVRFEFEYDYRNNSGKDRHTGTARSSSHRRNWGHSAFMFNGFYDICGCSDWCIKPFVGAGVGYTRSNNKHHNSGSSSRRNKNGFAWQVIAGIAYPFCDELDLSIEYRFFKNQQASNVYNNAVGVGLKYYF